MDLSFGAEYDEFRTEVKQFIAASSDKSPKQAGIGNAEAIAWQKILINNGYAARTIPAEYGGFGAEPDIIESRIIAEEFSNAQISTGLGGQGISMLTPVLLEMGTEEQKQQFIKPTIHGEMIWCQGYSEPSAGSDLASLTTKAELDGDEWVINGQKIWTSTAHLADWIFCLVRTEPEAPKHQGISFLLFSMDTPGIDIRPLVDMTGDANFNEVFFTDVRVPKDQIVGQRGQGWQVANAILGHERGSLAPPDAALSRLNGVIKLMNSESVNGERVIDNPIFRDRLMKIQGRVLAMKCNDMRLLSARINKGQDAKLAGMIVKLLGTELRHELEALAIDVMGEIGIAYGDNPYLRGNGSWQYQYMLFLGLIIGGGTSQIQKNIISERGLGMPREPKPAAKANAS
ncbi:MAG: acyl-CoA dehydrogenase [Gammaproteobacteria bacterium]|jgi:alkylation response protein AidB-like acyl-CoA dehydrogenase|nr:acyl-CoA dehydrogenase [Gammaproteobacteria bacterium]MCS5582381.1 acyl-CoA dehydrogenase family protein [Pseudomonadales bacterium]MBT6571356.1 acyl-CoA dehydrogenase [Gammaproteobacteria bacterium]MBT6664428.1 acyl-CoA dehydrogenase [Gammaproteobacteria bacterium]MBT7529527.1 acyl-CoA dehydrogenase [Gammaproteobacteria bacterium]